MLFVVKIFYRRIKAAFNCVRNLHTVSIQLQANMANIFYRLVTEKTNKILGEKEILDDREADKYTGEFQDRSKSDLFLLS